MKKFFERLKKEINSELSARGRLLANADFIELYMLSEIL